MEMELCPTCGASWRCECRPDDRKIVDVPDPYGPPIAKVIPFPLAATKGRAVPGPKALEEELLGVITAQPGCVRESMAKKLGFGDYYEGTGYALMVKKAINQALQRLCRRRRVLHDWGRYVLYTPERHAFVLAQAIRGNEWALARDERAITRQRVKLARQRAEFAALGLPDPYAQASPSDPVLGRAQADAGA